MVSLLEKVMMEFRPLCLSLDILGDITFVVRTCVSYFLQKNLELPLLAKAPPMVLTMKSEYFFAIFKRS